MNAFSRIFLLSLLLMASSFAANGRSAAIPPPPATFFQTALQRGLPKNGALLLVDVATQELTLVDAGGVLRRYAVSTAAAGVGNRQNSYRTPLGWHRVEERFGGTEVPGRVFIARVPQRHRLPPDLWRSTDSGDYVLTRILWLRGLEPGINAGPGIDSYQRTIYLHGTNQEHLLGQPASHGCIRLSNRDIMELYDLLEHREAWCLIVASVH